MTFLISLNLPGLQSLSYELSFSHQICSPPPEGKPPHLLGPPSAGPAAFYLVLSWIGFSFLPAHKVFRQANPTSPGGKQGSPRLPVTTKPAFHSPCGFPSWVQSPHGPAWCTVSCAPSVWICVANKLPSTSPVQCQGLSVWLSHTIYGRRSLRYQLRWIRYD